MIDKITAVERTLTHIDKWKTDVEVYCTDVLESAGVAKEAVDLSKEIHSKFIELEGLLGRQ